LDRGMKVITLIKFCLNKTYYKAHISTQFSDAISIQNAMK